MGRKFQILLNKKEIERLFVRVNIKYIFFKSRKSLYGGFKFAREKPFLILSMTPTFIDKTTPNFTTV
jgi:hypothetical protein